MPKMKHESKPFVYKVDARVHAMHRRDEGYTVVVKPASLYYKSRGYRWETVITGTRKKKISKELSRMLK